MLAVGYGAFVAFVVFWPSPVDRPVQSQLDKALELLHRHGVPAFVDYNFVEFSANIALFIPLGIMFGLAIPMRLGYLTLLCGPLLSGSIELIQSQLLAQRYATVEDVISNSLGATIGVLAAWVLRAAVASRDEQVIADYVATHRA